MHLYIDILHLRHWYTFIIIDHLLHIETKHPNTYIFYFNNLDILHFEIYDVDSCIWKYYNFMVYKINLKTFVKLKNILCNRPIYEKNWMIA
jgi:hypothetical protein